MLMNTDNGAPIIPIDEQVGAGVASAGEYDSVLQVVRTSWNYGHGGEALGCEECARGIT